MASIPAPIVVAILHRDAPILDLLKQLLDSRGFISFTADPRTTDPEQFVEDCHPDAVVYDLAEPYAESWTRLRTLKGRDPFARLAVVATTDDADALGREAGATGAIALFGGDGVFAVPDAVDDAVKAAARVPRRPA